MRRSSGLCPAAAASLVLSISAHAAIINWSGPALIANDSDVITTGTLVMAYNFSQTQQPVMVNTVPFAVFPIPNGANAIVGYTGIATIGIFNLESSDTSYGSTAAPFSGLSPAYRTLLGSGMGSSQGNTLTLNLDGLSNGSTYVFQCWANDSDLVHGGNPTTINAGNSAVVPSNASGLGGGLGMWVSGTFTATGSTQAINFSGARPVINAFQVREVPAPGAAALLGLAGLIASRRRRA